MSVIEQQTMKSIVENNSPRCTQQQQSFSSPTETTMGGNFGEKELFFVLLAFIFLAETWYMYRKYLHTKQQQDAGDCYNTNLGKSKSKEEVEKVVSSLMHKKVIAANKRSSIAVPIIPPLSITSNNDLDSTFNNKSDNILYSSPRGVVEEFTMALPTPSSLFNTCPPSPKTLYQKRKSDIYAPITPRRRSSLTTRYNFSLTNRLLSEACNICLGDYEEGEDICWSYNKECTHAFHKSCITKWLETHDVCPCCRLPYIEHQH